MNALHRILPLLILSGCASYGLNDSALESDNYDPSVTETIDTLAQQVRIDIIPSEPLDANGDIRALPTTVGLLDVPNEGIRGVDIHLSPPGLFQGLVTGASVTPTGQGATLPSITDAVPATVRIVRDQSVQSYVITTNDDGAFASEVVAPEESYLVSVVPDDALIPFETREVRVNANGGAQDFELGTGVALYGQVTTAGAPLANAAVFATDSYGTTSQPVLTNDEGWYNLRVKADGAYRVTTTGRTSGRDPSLDSVQTTIGADGGRIDMDYPNLVGSFAFGRVVDSEGRGLAGITARFTAKSLDGYEALSSSLLVEDITDAGGNFEARLMNGLYRVEFVPPEVEDASIDHPAIAMAEGVIVSGALDLGTVALGNLVAVSGQVLDGAGGQGVAKARITCTEVGFDGRSWSGFTDNTGHYELMLPPSPLRCQLIPPGERVDLAWTVEQVDMSIDDGHVFEFRTGRRITGNVDFDQEPEAFAVVEVRDGTGLLLGTTITDDAGQFDIQVDLPEE